jgi:predicted amidohydrolase
VLPELFATGYQFVSKEEVAQLGEEIPGGRTCEAMLELARDRGMVLVFGLVERDGERLYNAAAVAGPKGMIGTYRKTHLFFEEKLFFDPGDTGFRIFDVGPAKVGVMICFDWWFPESARILALMGADLICHPANLVLPGCQEAMKTRSLENGVFTVTANRIGREARGEKEPLDFTGRSQIVDPRGTVISRLGEEDTGLLLADVEPEKARDKSITPRNDRFRDRRPECYGTLTREA